MTTPEEKDHAELEPIVHPLKCDCAACMHARKEDAAQRVIEWNALFDDLERKRYRRNQGLSWKTALVGAAMLASLALPGHASAGEAGYLMPPAGCTLYASWEDHSSLAYCLGGTWIGFDPDGPRQGWQIATYMQTSGR